MAARGNSYRSNTQDGGTRVPVCGSCLAVVYLGLFISRPLGP